ncbi:facilitated trehalose transporter Tret1-like isoform X1 [Macrosteles quadrilineatus]|uniref:facilitated trehalose transporter Tret1-like isoform X1 n=1 Tax=Macrosteles quadrilineatus TaxID=74068 RepID=UPI0023E318A1|nr:facilitated trehalose transporter Tret1-like isoform X1 [Macrosteles quadrilineatus]
MGGYGRQCAAALAGSIAIFSTGMAYGWVSPVLNTITDENGEIRASKEQYSWIAADVEIGFFSTPFLASYLMDKFGRKRPMLITVLLSLVSWTLTITTRSVNILYLKRILDGMVGGVMLTVTPVYLAEIAEASIRGSVLLSITVTWFAGTLAQFCIGTYLSYNVSAAVNLIPPLAYCVLFSFLPESPYYLMMKKEDKKAAKSLSWFRDIQIDQAAKELTEISDYLKRDAENKKSWYDVMVNPIYRRCLFVVLVISLAVNLTGVTAVFAYATKIFAGTSNGFLNPDICSVVIASLFFVISIPVCLLIDKIGRRPLLLISTTGCCLSSLLSAGYFYYKDQIVYTWIPLVTVGLYSVFVSVGLNPVTIAFQGELFPSSVKSVASGMVQVFLTITSFVGIKMFYLVESYFGLYVNYIIYAVVGFIASILLYIYAPETKNKTFNQLLVELQGVKVKDELQEMEELKSLNQVT